MNNGIINKIHFAGCDVLTKAVITRAAGVNYALWSAYPHLINTINKPGMTKQQPPQKILSRWLCSNYRHVILDSGLYSLIFGTKKSVITGPSRIQRWQNEFINYIHKYQYTGCVVECDAQHIVGSQNIWKLREQLRASIPNEIIFVWHKKDGQEGLDRLIEYCDYIGLSFNEYQNKQKDYRHYIYRLVDYIKNKKPEIKIHLLGMSDTKTLKNRPGVYSCDSTSHLTGARYGRIGGFRVEAVKQEHYDEAIKTIIKWFRSIPELKDYKLNHTRLKWFTHLFVSVRYHLRLYESLAGNQD